MAKYIATLKDGNTQEDVYPRTKLQAISDTEENGLDSELTANDINALKDGKIQQIDTSLLGKENISSKVTSLSSSSTDTEYPSAKCVYDAINNLPSSSQVQTDWNQSDTSAVDYIKNKPDLSLKEDKSNKVTSISSSSTDTQYPSAKCVYDLVGNVESLLSAL